MLQAISPIDGRYADKTRELADFFSEQALIRYRVFVEVQYFISLWQFGLPQLADFPEEKIDDLNGIFDNFNAADAEYVKTIERTTNHDVKAVEYFLKEKFDALDLGPLREFVHFGLTSQDINNTATPLLFKNALQDVYYPLITQVRDRLEQLSQEWAQVPMLARTHGQPASPTLLGKEFRVFVERLDVQLGLLRALPYRAKFGYDDLKDNWMVVAEGTQSILRREGYPQPYEALKALTRGRSAVTREALHEFVDGLYVLDEVKEELKALTPHNYVGR